jgi:hypothetical protein
MEEESDDGPLLVPRVKVAEDGSIILDEERWEREVLWFHKNGSALSKERSCFLICFIIYIPVFIFASWML